MFRHHEIDPHDKPGIRYLYWGLTGARFGRSGKQTPAHRLWLGSETAHPEETPAETGIPRDASPENVIARLTAERDSAQSERELEADYREALLRNVEMLRKQLDDAQRRIRQFEAARAPEPVDKNNRQCELERELAEARRRILELETQRPSTPNVAPQPPAAVPVDGDDMMDIFLQFAGTQEQRPDADIQP